MDSYTTVYLPFNFDDLSFRIIGDRKVFRSNVTTYYCHQDLSRSAQCNPKCFRAKAALMEIIP